MNIGISRAVLNEYWNLESSINRPEGNGCNRYVCHQYVKRIVQRILECEYSD